MKLKVLLVLVILVISCKVNKSVKNQLSPSEIQLTEGYCEVKPLLDFKFGTVLKLKVQILDGDKLSRYYMGKYIMKVIDVNGSRIKDSISFIFVDETSNFPDEDFGLYKKLYGKEVGSLGNDEILEMKKKYVDKKFDIVAYEAGQFIGQPNECYPYQRIKQGTGFQFENQLIIISGDGLN